MRRRVNGRLSQKISRNNHHTTREIARRLVAACRTVGCPPTPNQKAGPRAVASCAACRNTIWASWTCRQIAARADNKELCGLRNRNCSSIILPLPAMSSTKGRCSSLRFAAFFHYFWCYLCCPIRSEHGSARAWSSNKKPKTRRVAAVPHRGTALGNARGYPRRIRQIVCSPWPAVYEVDE
jgi:hypothetical protein